MTVNPKTFLQLCQQTCRWCGITGNSTTQIPTTTVSQTGELGRIVEYVDEAWLQMQVGTEYRLNRRKFTLTTADSDDKYAYSDAIDVDTGLAITRFKDWHLRDRQIPPRIHTQSVGVADQTPLTFATWEEWEYLYKTGSIQSQTSRPHHIAVDPQDNIRLGLTPDGVYVVSGEYNRSAQVLTQESSPDAAVPDLPADFQNLIVYEAMLMYADYETAPDVEKRAERGKLPLMNALGINQGPKWRLGRPLA